MDLTLTLPHPHTKQAEIINHPAKRKTICAGRRFGKTHMAAMEGVERFLEGRRVLFASPTQDQVDTFWEMAKEWLRPMLDKRLVYKNESKRLMVFNHNGGRIKAKTAWNADTMKGDYGDFIVLDEFAQMHPDVWDFVVAPMLADTDGDCWFISTPLRRNHFFKLYQKALGDDTGRWAQFHATTHDNPHLSAEAVAELTADMSDTAYRQEIMAEFLEQEGAVFRNIAACLFAPLDATPDQVAAHRLVAGVDWGKERDFTVISIFDATTNIEVMFDRFNQIDYTFQRDRLASLCDVWGVDEVWVEHNSIGIPNFEALQRDGLPVVAFETTAKSKPPLIESLALAFEREEAQWMDIPIATGELESYERKVSATTGRSTYSAPTGLHDDSVMARGIVWWAALHRPQSTVARSGVSGLYTSRDERAQADRRRGSGPGTRHNGRKAAPEGY